MGEWYSNLEHEVTAAICQRTV